MNNLVIYYTVAIWFLIICVTNKEHRSLSVVLFVFYFASILLADFSSFVVGMEYIEKKSYLIYFEGILVVLVSFLMNRDSTAWRQAIIIAFALLIHSLMLLNLITTSQVMHALTIGIYEYYDELIITTAILQMVASYDGMVKGIDNAYINASRLLRRFLSGNFMFFDRCYKGLLTQKTRGTKT